MKIGKKIFAYILVVIVLLYKPTTLGAILTPVGMILMVGMLLLYGSMNGNRNFRFTKPGWKIILPIILYYFYCFVQGAFLAQKLDITYVKAGISILVFVFCMSIFMSDMEIRQNFVRNFILLLVFFVCSYLFTLPFSFIVSDIYSIKVFSYEIPGYGYNFAFYFPVTPATGRWTVMGYQFLRLSAFFRECGIAQLFYIWAYSECEYYFENVKRIKILLLLGVIFCFSTAGYVCLMAYLVMEFFIKKKASSSSKNIRKQAIALAISIVVLIALSTIPGIRLSDKNQISYDARMTTLGVAFETMKDNFWFGIGEYTIESTGNSFLQSCYRIGMIGISLYYIIYIIAWKNASDKKRFILANVANLLTLSFSQPIYDAPLVFLLILLPYGKDTLDTLVVSGKNRKIKRFRLEIKNSNGSS